MSRNAPSGPLPTLTNLLDVALSLSLGHLRVPISFGRDCWESANSAWLFFPRSIASQRIIDASSGRVPCVLDGSRATGLV